MNRSLLQQHAAFKQQGSATLARSGSAVKQQVKDEPPKKKIKSEHSNSNKTPKINTANKFKWLKVCIDMLKKRYKKEKKALVLEELMKVVGLSDLEVSEKAWLQKALHENPKVLIEKDKISFKPAYPIHNVNDLMNVLRQHNDNGMGGVLLEDIKECMSKAEETVEGLSDQVRSSYGQAWVHLDISGGLKLGVEYQFRYTSNLKWYAVPPKELRQGFGGAAPEDFECFSSHSTCSGLFHLGVYFECRKYFFQYFS